MAEFTAPSGAKVVINVAPWKDAKFLKQAIEREIDMRAGLQPNVTADTFMASILKIDSSELVDKALWPCLIRCTRNDQKIVEETFDSAEARRDYYDIIGACIKENLNPLVESLFSKLSEAGVLTKQAANNPSIASTTTPSSSPVV